MQNKRIETFLGFAIKSQNIVFGIDNVINPKKRYLIMYDSDISPNSKRKIEDFAQERGIATIACDTPVAKLANKDGCKVLAIKNKSMSDQIIAEYQRIAVTLEVE